MAGKSSEAAQETTVLLSETVESMEEGVQVAQDTADSMMKVVTQADEMSKLIDSIADYTRQQDTDATEITHGIEQISIVVQTNVATAEKSCFPFFLAILSILTYNSSWIIDHRNCKLLPGESK